MENFAQKRAAKEFCDIVIEPLLTGFIECIGRTMDLSELRRDKKGLKRTNMEIDSIKIRLACLNWYNWIQRLELKDRLAYLLSMKEMYEKSIAKLEARLGDAAKYADTNI